MSDGSRLGGEPPVSVGRVRPGDHLCHVVEAPGETETAAAAFLAGALERGHGALWLHGPTTAEACREALAFAGVEPDAAEASGALALRPAGAFFLDGGTLDLARVRARWGAELARVAAAGRGALFVALEGAPALAAGGDALVEWEASFGAPAGAAALCQFERATFPPALLRSIVRVHPLVLHRGRILQNHEVLTADAALAREAPEAELVRLLAGLRERGAADHALRASEQLHRLLAENAPDVIFRFRLLPTPAFEYVSPSAAALTGYTPEEHYADPDLGAKLVHPADRGKIDEALRSPDAPVVARWIRRDGRIVWIEQRVALVRDGAGRTVAVEGVVRDVTERVLAQAALRESEERLRFALECAGHAYVEVDADDDGGLPGDAARLLGYVAGELPPGGAGWSSLVHPDDRAARLAALQAHLEGRTAEYRAEYRARARDGSWRWLRAAGRRLPSTGGRVRLAGTLTDVTASHELAERARASERLAGLGALAGGLAHEVNNPLAALVSSLAHVREELGREPASERSAALLAALDDALDAAGRVGAVVRGLRQFAAPGERSGPVPVDVREELAAALGIARNELTHRARLHTALPAALPRVLAEPGELAQVFVNLLVNAAQAVPEDGSGEVRVEATEERGEVVIRIRDTGAGMAPEVLARALEPFFTTRAVGSGSGLGLAIAHGVVTAAGGRLELESAPGRGTCATVRLPPAAAPARSPAAASAAAPARPRVLVGDDEPLVGRSLARLLRATHEVTVLESAAEAHRRLAAGERWDAVLCDLMMPELSGMDLEDRLRADAPDVLPRVVYMTGGAFTERARAFLAGGRPWLEKPLEPAALRAAIAARVRAGSGEG